MISTKSARIPKFIHNRLPADAWHRQKAEHEQKIDELIGDYLRRRSQQQKDPVMDFLFEYYAFRPSHLRSWSPGLGILLEEARSVDWRFDEMTAIGEHLYLDIEPFPEERNSSLRWILKVLENSAERAPSFGCFGMHEWAMVYKAQKIRHNHLSLRMNREELTEFVESRPLVCTHFDAFRFFTEEAKPQNKFELNRENFADMEQPGCLHTNMDLYKWAFKMYPWISSRTIRQAFVLAMETRVIDMKASPYDLRERGLKPIKIETKDGQQEYIRHQQAIYERSQPIRTQLIREYRHLLEAIERRET